MSKQDNLTDFLTDVADAIREKKGTTDKISPLDFSEEIRGIETGATHKGVKDVNFYDYEGTLLYSYTKEEFLALQAPPALPTSEGLTCQGWNYSFEKAQEYVTSYGELNIGAMYITDDGKTRLHIKIAAKGRMTVTLFFSQTKSNGVAIDWGDGSAPITLTGTGAISTSHTYAEIGRYTISLNPAEGCTLSLGMGPEVSVMGSLSDTNAVYRNMLQAVEIGKGVTYIGYSAFSNCYSLASITIPKGITSIGYYAFQYCYSLASITIPEGVTSISNYAFQYCYSLANITIPEGITSIDHSAFSNCYSLASITIPKGVIRINDYAFTECYSLASITIPEGVTSISYSAFSHCYSLASITIPEGVTSISYYAFSNCYSLASITIPEGVTSISEGAFQYCYSLANITIPEGITSISEGAFQNCYSLASITIPKGVIRINDYAFYNCTGMAFYDFSNVTKILTLGGTSFNSMPSDCKIVVPDALYDQWIASTNWAAYADRTVKASEFED